MAGKVFGNASEVRSLAKITKIWMQFQKTITEEVHCCQRLKVLSLINSMSRQKRL